MTAQMDSTALAFPDDTFSHSLMGFMFLKVGEGADVVCARENRRTLRPGGLALVATWEDLPTMAVFRQALQRLHDDDDGTRAALPDMLQMHGYGGRQVEQAMLRAGFAADEMRMERYLTEVRVADTRRRC